MKEDGIQFYSGQQSQVLNAGIITAGAYSSLVQIFNLANVQLVDVYSVHAAITADAALSNPFRYESFQIEFTNADYVKTQAGVPAPRATGLELNFINFPITVRVASTGTLTFSYIVNLAATGLLAGATVTTLVTIGLVFINRQKGVSESSNELALPRGNFRPQK